MDLWVTIKQRLSLDKFQSIWQNYAKKIENIFYFLRLCNSTYNKNTYGFLTYIWYIIAAACWYFFFFAQLVVTLPPFFFQKCCQYNTYCFQYIKLIFDFLLKKKKLFMCVVYAFKVSMKKIMLWILKMFENKNKTKSSKIKVRFGLLRAIF